ncbi:MAG: RNA polymerase sigma-70 factor [Rhodothermales bacterium]|nr:RNA polymerase sigma-70 factor [Rhodothermales bacterium]
MGESLTNQESRLPSEDSFVQWSHRLQSSDQRAFSELFRAMHTTLLRYAWRFTGEQEAARDIVQDAFLKLWQIREEVDPSRSLKALLYTMVRNLALNHVRAAQYTNDTLPEYDLHDRAPGADQQVEAAMLDERLRRFIHEMPDRRREAFMLSRFEGLSHEEIAQVMSLTPRTVNTHIVLALKDLRARLGALQPDTTR